MPSSAPIVTTLAATPGPVARGHSGPPSVVRQRSAAAEKDVVQSEEETRRLSARGQEVLQVPRRSVESGGGGASRSPRPSFESQGEPGHDVLHNGVAVAMLSSDSRSTTATPRSPVLSAWNKEAQMQEEAKLRQRRAERAEKSQAFRDWLKRQRAAKDSHQPATPDCRTEIYCPGFPVMSSGTPEESRRQLPKTFVVGAELRPSPAVAAKLLRPTEMEPPSFEEAVNAAVAAASQALSLGSPRVDLYTASDLEGTPPDSTGSAPVRSAAVGSVTSSASTVCAIGAPFAGCSYAYPLVEKCITEGPGNYATGDVGGDAPSAQEEVKRSVSIGDRIEGIRACLEARMGTQRFQKLYRSLVADEAAAANLLDTPVPWPRDSSVVLPEEFDEVFSGASNCETDDLSALVPLVAKLVACEQSYFS